VAVEGEGGAAFRRAVDRLSDDGARLVGAHPDAGCPTRVWHGIAIPEGFASEGPLLHHDGIDPATREIVESGRSATAADYLDAQERRTTYTSTWQRFFERYDVLLAP